MFEPYLLGVAGVTVEEFGRLAPVDGDELFTLAERRIGASRRQRLVTESSRRRFTFTYLNREITAGHLYELLRPAAGKEVIGTWSNRFASGAAAITARPVGKGVVIYLGTYPTDDLIAHFAPSILDRAEVLSLLPDLPEGVEVTMRQAAERRLMFILNTREHPVHVRGVPDVYDLLAERTVVGHAIHLGAYGCSTIHLRDVA